jgi:hypothetical protein
VHGWSVVEAAGAVTAVLAALGALWRFVVVPSRRLLRMVGEFLRDWRGEPARPGHRAAPGVPERLAAIEQELRTNSGSTLRDVVLANSGRIADLADAMSEHLTKADRMTDRIEEDLERVRLAGHQEAEAMWNALAALADTDRGRRDGDPTTEGNTA